MNNRSEKVRNVLFQIAVLFAVYLGIQQTASGVMQNGASIMQPAVIGLERRFIARGVIVRIQPPAKGIHAFILKIAKTERLEGYANDGAEYQGKEVEILSEMGVPAAFKVGATVSVVLRFSGDEWQQSLFLVEVIHDRSR